MIGSPFQTAAATLALLYGIATAPAAADTSCPPGSLGTSRVVTVGGDPAQALGLKSYPETLALDDHELVLTFDDGPLPATTPRVLDALAKECVRATFFLIGRNADASPALVRREVAAGHTVGSHSFSHPEVTLRGMTDAAARADIQRGMTAVSKAASGTAAPDATLPFFRFPGFADTAALDAWLASRHVTVFGADLWASDWMPMTPDAELDLLMKRIEAAGRGIVLLHDIKAQTAAMLPTLLERLKAEHFHIVHMVPGPGATPIRPAPSGWHSVTEPALVALWPTLVRHGALSPMPH